MKPRHFKYGWNPLTDIQFLAWCDEFDKIMGVALQISHSYIIDVVESREPFREAFNEGLSPDETVDDEIQAGCS